MKQAKKSFPVWAVFFWLLIWQGASMALAALYPHGSLLLPSPLSATARLLELIVTLSFWKTIATSSVHILGGFLLSCALAVLLAALAARYRRVEELLTPLVAAVKTVPVASFIILALVWLSSRTLPLFIAALMVFPPIYLNVLEGIRHTDRALLEMAHIFRVPFRRTLRGVYLPQVLPHFRSAASAALGLCWKAGSAAEVIALSTGSIGEQLYNAKIYFMTADLFAWTLAIVLISAFFEQLFLRLIDILAERVGI